MQLSFCYLHICLRIPMQKRQRYVWKRSKSAWKIAYFVPSLPFGVQMFMTRLMGSRSRPDIEIPTSMHRKKSGVVISCWKQSAERPWSEPVLLLKPSPIFRNACRIHHSIALRWLSLLSVCFSNIFEYNIIFIRIIWQFHRFCVKWFHIIWTF